MLMRVLVSISLVLVIGAFVMKLATAPLYARYSAHECQDAYSRARSRADTARLDLHPYAAGDTGRHTCGEVRGVTVSAPADLSALRLPDEEL